MNSLLTVSAWGRPDSPFQTFVSVRTACLLAVAGAIATVAVVGLPTVGLVIGCVSVAGLFSCYPLFSLLWRERDGRTAELTFTLVGVVAIVLAVTIDPRWLTLGWAAHGLWDLLHHRDHHTIGLRGIPHWWIQGCVVWDLLAAVGILIFL
ncbi:hypothetical protein [Nocardia sp. NPDC046763]|uniref:hypothetical protein n=1 Tax=Nocardia sp. NPDC046763 TaxID=3155256 RepID=UPI00340CA6C6